MKLSRKLLCSVMCYTLASIATFSVCAEENNVLSISSDDQLTAVYDEQILDDPLSHGIRVLAYGRPFILSGTSDDNIQLSAELLDNYNGYVPSSLRIISLPDSEIGTLIYNSEPMSTGQSVSVLSLSSLYYVPKSTGDAEFMFSTDNTNIMRCIIRQKDTENTPPAVTDNSSVTTYTRLDTAVAGYLDGVDSDGDSITYEIVSRPSKGILSISDENSGKFIYHPYEGMSGNDSFTYRICDAYGAYSDSGTIEINIEQNKANVYSDMNDSYCTSAANDVVSAGIMQTRKADDAEFFDPNEPVSRIDFLIMAMKVMGAGEAEAVSSTPFADDSTLSDTEKGYLSAAYRLGIIKGTGGEGNLVFMPDDAITNASAAVILYNIIDLPETQSSLSDVDHDDIPAWAVASVSALTNEGIIDNHIPANSVLTRENTAVIFSKIMHKLA